MFYDKANYLSDKSGYNSLPIYNICIAKSFYSSSLNNNYTDGILTVRLDLDGGVAGTRFPEPLNFSRTLTQYGQTRHRQNNVYTCRQFSVLYTLDTLALPRYRVSLGNFRSPDDTCRLALALLPCFFKLSRSDLISRISSKILSLSPPFLRILISAPSTSHALINLGRTPFTCKFTLPISLVRCQFVDIFH